MKELCITLVLILVMSLTGLAQAEGMDMTNRVISKDAINAELIELQERADALYGEGLGIKVKLIENTEISVGQAKYPTTKKSVSRTWFDEALDWVTFWD